VEEERLHWHKREEAFREEVHSLLANQGLAPQTPMLVTDQLEEKEEEINVKDKKIEELRQEMEGLHVFYKDQMSMIEKNYGDSSFNNVTAVEHMQNHSQSFANIDQQPVDSLASEAILMENNPTQHPTPQKMMIEAMTAGQATADLGEQSASGDLRSQGTR